MNKDPKKHPKIYIMLSNPQTIVARMIGLYTRAPYNHASIAFDAELSEIYSFGRKHPLIPIFGGFVRENIHSPIFKNASCAIFSCEVSPQAYANMYNFVKELEANQDQYTYNFLGLLGIILNIEMGSKNSYFCSQFVSSVLHQGGIKLIDKSAALTTPADFEYSALLRPIFRGKLETYRKLCCYRRNISPRHQSLYVVP